MYRHSKMLMCMAAVAAGVLLMPAEAAARTFETDDWVWNLDDEALTAELVEPFRQPRGSVIIPESVEAGGKVYLVTAIAPEALSRLGNITSISLPETVTTLGKDWCSYSTAVEELNIPDGVTELPDPLCGLSSLRKLTVGSGIDVLTSGTFPGGNIKN